MWVAALKLGYSRKELAVMPYGEVIFDLAAMSDNVADKRNNESEVAVKRATQADIRSMLG